MNNIPYCHPAWIEIDCAQFKNNIAHIRKKIGEHTLLCLPVKANAYGHGLIPLAQAAESFGVNYLAVSCLQEGIMLREASIATPILVMGAIHENQIYELIKHELDITVASAFKAQLIAQVCEDRKIKARVHIEVDTGMRRTGMRVETAYNVLLQMQNHPFIEVVGIYSHLATADKKEDCQTQEQIALFAEFKEKAEKIFDKKVLFHLANSGGIVYYPESYFDMVRPGLLAFGYYPGCCENDVPGIQPFFSLKAKISYFKVVDEGQGISYGHLYKTKKSSRIVTIPVGYGDGFRRALSHKAHVLIRGKRYPIVGSICMDQLMVDIGLDEAYVGDEVVLVGHQGSENITINEIASFCDTIPYEILCGFNQRLPRIFI